MKAAAGAIRVFQALASTGWRGRATAAIFSGLLRLIRPRRERIDANLRLVYPERDGEWRRDFRARVYENLAWTLTEILALQRDPAQAMDWVTDVEGRQPLEELFNDERGAILLTGHFGNWELLGAWYAGCLAERGRQLHVVYQEIHDRDISNILREFRERCGMAVLPKSASTLEMVRMLKGGAHIAILADVSWMGDALMLPFMGCECTNSPGPAILSMLASVPIVPIAACRQAPFQHRVRLFSPISVPAKGNRQERLTQTTLAINHALEEIIQERPDLWFWLHNRWKRY